jgi:hypothetical protein
VGGGAGGGGGGWGGGGGGGGGGAGVGRGDGASLEEGEAVGIEIFAGGADFEGTVDVVGAGEGGLEGSEFFVEGGDEGGGFGGVVVREFLDGLEPGLAAAGEEIGGAGGEGRERGGGGVCGSGGLEGGDFFLEGQGGIEVTGVGGFFHVALEGGGVLGVEFGDGLMVIGEEGGAVAFFVFGEEGLDLFAGGGFGGWRDFGGPPGCDRRDRGGWLTEEFDFVAVEGSDREFVNDVAGLPGNDSREVRFFTQSEILKDREARNIALKVEERAAIEMDIDCDVIVFFEGDFDVSGVTAAVLKGAVIDLRRVLWFENRSSIDLIEAGDVWFHQIGVVE